MRLGGLIIGLSVATAACGGGGASTPPGGGPTGPIACALDTDCGSSSICEAGHCQAVVNDYTYPRIIARGPRHLQDLGVHEPIWFEFNEPVRLAPGGIRLYEWLGARTFQATAELSTDRRTVTLHPIDVTPPVQLTVGLTHVTDLSGHWVMEEPFATYLSWWPVTQDLTGAVALGDGGLDVAVDGSGGVTAAWTALAGGVSQARVDRWNGSTWTSLGAVNADPAHQAAAPALAARGGTVAVAFREEGAAGWEVVVRTWTPAGGWSAPLGGTVDATHLSGTLDLEVDSAGMPVVVLVKSGTAGLGQQVVVHRWDGGAWQLVGGGALNLDPAHGAFEPQIALDTSERPVVSFREEIAFPLSELEVKAWTGSEWRLLGGAAAAAVPSGRHALATTPDGGVAVGYLDDTASMAVRLLGPTGWSAPEVVSNGGERVMFPTLVSGPGGLWAGYGWGLACHAYLRGDSGWTSMGSTDDPQSYDYACGAAPLAASPSAGPYAVFGNAGSANYGDLCVYGFNR